MKRTFFFSLFFLSGLFAKEKKVFLLHKYTKGASYRYSIKNDINNVNVVSGNRMTSKTHTEMVIKEEIKDVKNDTVKIVFIIEDAKGNVEVEGGSFPIKEMEMMKGKKIKVLLYKNQVIKTEGIEGSNFLSSLSSSYQFLPRDSIACIGERWKKNFSENGREEKYIYTLRGIETLKGKKCAVISFEAEVKEKGERKRMRMKANVDIKGKGSGIIYFAIDEGVIVKEETHMKLEGVVDFREQKIYSTTEMESILEMMK